MNNYHARFSDRVLKPLMRRAAIIPMALVGLLLVTACDPLGSRQQVMALIPTATLPPTLVPTQLAMTNTPILASTPTFGPTGLPTIVVTCNQTAGQVIDDTFTSQNAHAKIAYRVYLPPCYWQSSRRYPYVILLASGTGDQTQWTAALHLDQVLDQAISKGTLPPMIVVMPDGGTLQSADNFHAGASFTTLITGEVIPTVEQRFCTWGSRDGRAIGGLGSGGYWAFVIGLLHPELFSAIGGHSPTFTPDPSIARSALPSNGDLLNLAQTVRFTAGQTPRLMIDSGLDDANRATIDLFAQTLTTRHITIGNVLYPSGIRTNALWTAHVGDDLAFYGKSWPHSQLDLPSCLQ